MKKNKLLVVAGPSGGGKTAVTNLIAQRDPRFTFLRSATTRAKRGDGNDGEYIYLSRDEFLSLEKSGGFVESTEYNGELYGTTVEEVKRAAAEEKIPLLVLDTKGAVSLAQRADIDACAIYAYSDLNALEERLYLRYVGDSPTVEGITAYAKRRDRNIADYLSIEDSMDAFYSFIPNDSTLEELADNILSTFDDFCKNIEKNIEQNKNAAASLEEQAQRKSFG